jgi:hypothetical protein
MTLAELFHKILSLVQSEAQLLALALAWGLLRLLGQSVRKEVREHLNLKAEKELITLKEVGSKTEKEEVNNLGKSLIEEEKQRSIEKVRNLEREFTIPKTDNHT